MSDPATLSDAELRNELIALGANVGPVTATTRSIYEKQLEKRRAAASGTAPSPVTKARTTTSRSPSRVSKKIVTSSTVEIVHKRSGVRLNQSELENENLPSSVKEFENVGVVEDGEAAQTIPPVRILRSRDVSVHKISSSKPMHVQEVISDVNVEHEVPEAFRSYDSSITKDSPETKMANTIYSGLSTPNSISKPTASKLSERVPTPPRITKLNDRSSYYPESAKSSYNTSGVFSDITADFASRERFTDTSFLRNRVVNANGDQDEDDDDDDDHMESSRIIYPSENKAVSFMSSMSQIPSYAYGAVTAPFKKPDHCVSAYNTNISKSRKPYSLGRRTGSDVANILLCIVSCMLLLLFTGYFGVIHSEKVVAASLLVAELTKETFGLIYTYAVQPIIIIACVCGAIMVCYLLRQRLLSANAAKRKKVFDLIERITDIIRESAANGQEYIAEPHVRDMLIPPSERTKGSAKWKRWQEAIRFINENESRVSTESRVINGVECAVWRWVPANKLGWQGNAFGDRSHLNVPDHALSHCLKLRGLFSSARDRDGKDVESALLQKLNPIKPLHVKVECGSKDGVVFARFASLNDCKLAFTALHGSWFNGQLVSAKYLRDERYEERFPNVRNARR